MFDREVLKNTRIKELRKEEEIRSAFPVMRQLRTHLDEAQYMELVKEAKEKDHYLMYALLEDDDIVAVCGFKPMITLYYGRFVWVCDLVTDQKSRSRGYGNELLSFIHSWAEDKGYESVALSSGLQRKEAHKFYEEKMMYDKASFVFKKTL